MILVGITYLGAPAWRRSTARPLWDDQRGHGVHVSHCPDFEDWICRGELELRAVSGAISRDLIVWERRIDV